VGDRLLAMVGDLSSRGGRVECVRSGSFGNLPAETATPLAMVLTEVLQNAVEHGFGDRSGRVRVDAARLVGRLRVVVEDDGRGLPPGFDPESTSSLGLSIVRTLVESELDGTFAIGPAPGSGTRVSVDLPVR